ncbi:unnamed protein product [Discosporangium mesarthrocarpum]
MLLELDLSHCGEGEEGDQAFRGIAQAVEENDALCVLRFEGNHLSTETLDELTYSLGRRKSPIRELLARVERTAQPENSFVQRKDLNPTEDESAEADQGKGVAPLIELGVGQVAKVPVALGRKDNMVGTIMVSNDTTLEEARALVSGMGTLPIGTEFSFVSGLGQDLVIPVHEEKTRRVVWDCSLPLRLRPASWVILD